MRLPAGERVEQSGPVERNGVEPLLLPHVLDRLGLEDEVRPPAEGRDEVVRRDGWLAFLAHQVGLDEVEAPLGCRVDDGTFDRTERSLRERRERADGLDLVAEQLDPERVATGGRVDVDDPAADGELAALLDPLDPLVASEGEVLREGVDPRLVAHRELEPVRPCLRRRHLLGERRRRRADQPAALQHVERAGTLADEMRRRLEPGVPADAAAWEQRHSLVAEIPGGGLGSVAGVGVLRQQDEQRAAEAEKERREEQRQARLGDTGARSSKVGRERGEPLGAGQLEGERLQRRWCRTVRLVHDERRNRRFRVGSV